MLTPTALPPLVKTARYFINGPTAVKFIPVDLRFYWPRDDGPDEEITPDELGELSWLEPALRSAMEGLKHQVEVTLDVAAQAAQLTQGQLEGTVKYEDLKRKAFAAAGKHEEVKVNLQRAQAALEMYVTAGDATRPPVQLPERDILAQLAGRLNCEVCGRVCKSLAGLRSHMRSHRSDHGGDGPDDQG